MVYDISMPSSATIAGNVLAKDTVKPGTRINAPRIPRIKYPQFAPGLN